MKQKQNLKLRIAQNGKVTDRYLRGKEEFTVGRSPDNNVVLYGEGFPKRLRVFVPTASGYELRLAENSIGEVVYDESRLAFSDLLLHDLLPRHEGCPALPLTPGKSGHLVLSDIRIDFAFDGAAAGTVQFEGFSPFRAFTKSLTQDPFFKGLVTVLLVLQMVAVQWASTVKIAPPGQADQAKLLQKVQKIAATFKPVEEIRAQTELKTETTTATESTTAENSEKKKEEPNAAEKPAKEKKGYGSDKPGEGVNIEEVGVLALIGGAGTSDGSTLMNRLINDKLAKGLDQVMSSGKLSAGRSESANSNTDLNALLAYGELGAGKGGNSSIDDILKKDAASAPAVKLEKKSKIDVAPIEKVTGSQEAVGARNEQSLYKVLSQNIGRLQYIYEKFLKTNPDIRGKVEVEVTINPNGSIANVAILSSEIPIPDFQRQLVDAIRRWKYDAIAQGQMKVVYPIVFNKIN
ncbi:TonB family protein [candidate division KSB1 bacterium]|nr:TonB family protein [candidate division KSB1 bacterium]